MSALNFEAVKVALKQDATGYVLTLKIHPDEIPEELLRDFVGARYGVAMVRIESDESPRAYPMSRTKQAGMLCRDRQFQKFIEHLEGTSCDEKEAAAWVQHMCDITSRAELNGNKDAQQRFDDILDRFKKFTGERDEPF